MAGDDAEVADEGKGSTGDEFKGGTEVDDVGASESVDSQTPDASLAPEGAEVASDGVGIVIFVPAGSRSLEDWVKEEDEYALETVLVVVGRFKATGIASVNKHLTSSAVARSSGMCPSWVLRVGRAP